MPSRVFEQFHQAMRERKQITCLLNGKRRELCPIILGHSDGREKALVFQFGGESSSKPLPPEGEWRCMTLSEVTEVALRDGPWRDGGGNRGGTQSCVKVVAYDVNPNSPYDPTGRLI